MRTHPAETRETLAQLLILIAKDLQTGTKPMIELASDLQEALEIADDLAKHDPMVSHAI